MGDLSEGTNRAQVRKEIVQLKDKRHLSFEQISIEIEDLVGHKVTRQAVYQMYMAEKRARQREFAKSLEVRQVAKLLATGHWKKDLVKLTGASGKKLSLYVIDRVEKGYPGEMNEAKVWAKTTINQMLLEGQGLKEIRKALTINRMKPREAWLVEAVAEQWVFIAKDKGIDNDEAVMAMYKLTGDVGYTRAVGKKLGVPVNATRLSKGIV